MSASPSGATIRWRFFSRKVVRVEIKESNDDEDDVMLLWIGGEHHEVSRAEDLIRPLAPFAVLTPDHIDMLEAGCPRRLVRIRGNRAARHG